MKKQIITFSLAGTLLIGGVAPVSAEAVQIQPISTIDVHDQRTFTTKDASFENKYLKATIKIPVFQHLQDKQFQQRLNDQIGSFYKNYQKALTQEAAKFAKEAKENDFPFHPYALTIDYDVKTEGDFVSIVLKTYTYTGGANGMSFVDSFNFTNEEDTKLTSLFTIADEKALTKLTAEAIEAQYGEFYGLNKLSEDIAFYIEGNDLNLIFDKYEIAAGAAGTPTVQLSYEEVTSNPNHAWNQEHVTVKGEQLASYVQHDANVTMVELRKLGKELGYKVKWNLKTSSAELTKGANWTSVTVGENRYTFAKTAPFELEAAPELKKGKVYVPVSFAKDVLRRDVNVNEERLLIQ